MTKTSSEAHPLRTADLGTLMITAWSGEAPDGHDMAYLLACSLGNAPDGPEAATAAVERLLNDNGLPVGGGLVDGNVRLSLPVTLLVVAGHAVVTMPHLNAKCPVPPQWLAAVAKRGYAYFVFTTRPWPEASRESVTTEGLAAFAGSEETLKAAAHIVLPARSLRS
ncbi:DUF5949 family protein [Streptomyces canus]|uniref:DUF5949 family protein n=1 Tax=Streptomyces canus TaxID=58343 RepID=UPI002254C794|nr:DUF5949 family protein [Streptomyces canus]MCX5259256.1 DUF5949 family protein [Streptomyces canus]